MTPEEHRETARLFDEACQLDPSEAGRFLDRACAGRPELREMVESLLASHAELESSDHHVSSKSGPAGELAADPDENTIRIDGFRASVLSRFLSGTVQLARRAVESAEEAPPHGSRDQVESKANETGSQLHLGLLDRSVHGQLGSGSQLENTQTPRQTDVGFGARRRGAERLGGSDSRQADGKEVVPGKDE